MRLYVGNLNYRVDDAGLRQMFEPFGRVEDASVCVDRDTKRARGFGFVEIDEAGAKRAIEALHESEHEGRRLTVNEARSKEDGRRGGRRGGRRDGRSQERRARDDDYGW